MGAMVGEKFEEVECGTGWEESKASLRLKPKETALIQLIQSTALGFGYIHSKSGTSLASSISN